ncbi:MAG: GNAT family N-acetyltransferase [Candidatus Atribacteria bacterium]|nr:GNAT family N-acetyltransferase [Candidatus Atribacteria bacterium]
MNEKKRNKMFILETEKLKLIPLDANNLRYSIEDRQKMEWNLGVKITDTELEKPLSEAMRTSLEMVLENKKDYLWFTSWEIVLKKENRIIGGLCFKGCPDEKGRVEIGYGMQDEYKCKGYMTEAVKELIDWAFRFNHVTEVIAETEKDNLPSHRVLEKIGMEKYKENGNYSGHSVKWPIK